MYQLHALDTLEDLDRVFGERGAMRAILEAREQGLVKHVGITSHNKAVLLKALERFDFDVVMTPITVGSMLYPRPENDFRPLLRVARDRGIGVIAIKAIARGRWGGRPRRYQTWYEPFDDPEDVRMALSLVLSQEGVVAYSLPCDVRLWPPVLDAAEKVEELDKEGVRRALEYFRRRGAKPLFPEDLAEQLAREES
ncbi:MAG: hypothetical protein DRK00_06330 [Thermoprotei archaeon]|nr:MAG: hypothetical protein DRK00_06330 [Thermoprotei archaeon]